MVGDENWIPASLSAKPVMYKSVIFYTFIYLFSFYIFITSILFNISKKDFSNIA